MVPSAGVLHGCLFEERWYGRQSYRKIVVDKGEHVAMDMAAEPQRKWVEK